VILSCDVSCRAVAASEKVEPHPNLYRVLHSGSFKHGFRGSHLMILPCAAHPGTVTAIKSALYKYERAVMGLHLGRSNERSV